MTTECNVQPWIRSWPKKSSFFPPFLFKRTLLKPEQGLWIRQQYCNSVHFLSWELDCGYVTEPFVFRNHTLKSLVIKERYICNSLSNGTKTVCVEACSVGLWGHGAHVRPSPFFHVWYKKLKASKCGPRSQLRHPAARPWPCDGFLVCSRMETGQRA